MSKVKNKKDNDFQEDNNELSEEEYESNDDEPESDDLSVDSEAGPSSPRLKRMRKNPILGGASSNGVGGIGSSGNKGKGKEVIGKSGKKVIGGNNKGKGKGKAWEGALEYTWDSIREDEDGGLASAMSDALLGSRAKRCVPLSPNTFIIHL